MKIRNIFHPTSERKSLLINNVSIIVICLVFFSYAYPGFQETGFADWRDPLVIGLSVAGGSLVIGCLITTVPAWFFAGGICAVVGGGIALWDWADGGDEDN